MDPPRQPCNVSHISCFLDDAVPRNHPKACLCSRSAPLAKHPKYPLSSFFGILLICFFWGFRMNVFWFYFFFKFFNDNMTSLALWSKIAFTNPEPHHLNHQNGLEQLHHPSRRTFLLERGEKLKGQEPQRCLGCCG